MTKKSMLIVYVSVLLIAVIGLAFLYRGSDSLIKSRALNVIDSLQAGKYQEAEKDFHVGLRTMRSPEVLGQEWTKTVALFGPLKERTVTGTHSSGNGAIPSTGKIVEMSLVFEKGTLYAHIPFDISNEITGLVINRHQGSSDSKSDSIIVNRALNVIDSLQTGNYQEAEKDFYSDMKAKLSPEALGQSWSKTIAKYGPLKKRILIRVDNRFMENRCVEINCVFEKATLYGYIRFNTKNEVTGVRIRTEPDPFQK